MLNVPNGMTANETKRQLYLRDPYFRDTWDDATSVLQSEKNRVSMFGRMSLLIIRPDAIVSRRVDEILRDLEDLGLRAIYCTPIQYTRNTVREGWRYQLNIATRDRIDVMDMVLTESSSILAVLMSEQGGQVPATVQFSQRKGPSNPIRRLPHHLRFRLGKAQVSVLTFVHISDEPADVVREMGVFLSQAERVIALRAARDNLDRTLSFHGAVERQYSEQPAEDLLLVNALTRVRGRLASMGKSTETVTAMDLIDQICDQRSFDWRRLLALCETSWVPVSRWEKVAIAGALSKGHYQHALPVLPDIGLDAWSSLPNNGVLLR